MKLEILLFGIAREIVGSSRVQFDLDAPLDVKAFKLILEEKYPRMNHLSYYKVAVNQEFAKDEQLLQQGDEIALIPPVSGG